MTEQLTPPKSLLLQMTDGVTSEDLRYMVVDQSHLPADLSSFKPLREEARDNRTYAKHSGGSYELLALETTGRLGGHEVAFAIDQGGATLAEEPAELLEAGTAVHLFNRDDQARHWIDAEFVTRLRNSVGLEDESGQKLTGVELLEPSGFHSHCAGLLLLSDVPGGMLASTVVEFQLGRLVGTSWTTAKVDKVYLDLSVRLGIEQERQIVRTVLGS